ncbi:MAG TPA: hypothetical protein VEC99_11695 [Clostridia bacterium]|nr:hypothetical protein [Clostridia bacterium]
MTAPNDKVTFLETTAVNQGFLYLAFTEESQAIQWLKGRLA